MRIGVVVNAKVFVYGLASTFYSVCVCATARMNREKFSLFAGSLLISGNMTRVTRKLFSNGVPHCENLLTEICIALEA